MTTDEQAMTKARAAIREMLPEGSTRMVRAEVLGRSTEYSVRVQVAVVVTLDVPTLEQPEPVASVDPVAFAWTSVEDMLTRPDRTEPPLEPEVTRRRMRELTRAQDEARRNARRTIDPWGAGR